MTLPEFLYHKEMITQLDDIKYARYKDEEMKTQNKGR